MGRITGKTAIRRYPAGRSRALLAACELLVERAPLIRLLALREIRDRYVGSMLGTAWSVLQPLLLMLVLITIFGHVFSMKRAGMTGEGFDLVAYMIAGYVPWLMTGAALQSAAGVSGPIPVVKQISFPVAVLPANAVLAQAPMLLVGLAVFLLYTAAAGTGISPLVLLPGLVVIHAVLLFGLTWAIAALGAYFRDLDPILSNLLMLNVFLLPIFMPPGAAPAILAPVISYNPFTPLIAAYQDVLVFGVVRSPISMLLLVGLALPLHCRVCLLPPGPDRFRRSGLRLPMSPPIAIRPAISSRNTGSIAARPTCSGNWSAGARATSGTARLTMWLRDPARRGGGHHRAQWCRQEHAAEGTDRCAGS